MRQQTPFPDSKHTEARARDALAFEPLPASKWITVIPEGIAIATNYSESLSRLLRSLPGNHWQPEHRRWLLPYTSASALRAALPEIERLAASALERATAETERRERERLAAAERRRQELGARAERLAAIHPRPLLEEYLRLIPGRPLHNLALEAIGDDTDKLLRRFGGGPPRQAVAQIMGSHGRGGWARAYLLGARDYSRANSTGSRGIMVNYQLEEGPIYWVAEPKTWHQTERYFLRIIDAHRIRMTEEEVRTCLAK